MATLTFDALVSEHGTKRYAEFHTILDQHLLTILGRGHLSDALPLLGKV